MLPVRFGIKVSGQATAIDAMRDCWKVADEAGFDHLWNFDHLIGVQGLPESPIFDAWSLLAAMAGATSRVRIGCLVSGNMYRHPALMAKVAVTVDHLSAGRLEFGIGASSGLREGPMFGLPIEHRVGRLDEALQVITSLWTGEQATFQGRYYRLDHALSNPKPVQMPHPPIWLGGHGPMTIRLAARYAAVWNATDSAGGPKRAGQVGRHLQEECEKAGRDPEAVRWSAQVFWDGTDRHQLRSEVAAFLAEGFTEIIIFPDVRLTKGDLLGAVSATADELDHLREMAT